MMGLTAVAVRPIFIITTKHLSDRTPFDSVPVDSLQEMEFADGRVLLRDRR